MIKSSLLLGLLFVLAVVLADRPDIASTIPDSFWVEIKLEQGGVGTQQKIYISKSLNKAKSVQTVDIQGKTETFITIADFNLKKVSVYSGDHDMCDYDDITINLNFVDDLRAMFTDPEVSPMKEEKGMNMFTVNWKSIEGVDDWTHFYFDKSNNSLRLFEHYFKEQGEDPWVAFDVITPITAQDFEDSEFENADCPITAETFADM